ncbi:MAG: hypothetical protein V4542_17585 [Pseudomonadota bacterium]
MQASQRFRSAGHGVSNGKAPFNGVRGPLLKALSAADAAASRSELPDAGESQCELYVRLRREYRELMGALFPDLVQIHKARRALDAIEETMRVQRLKGRNASLNQ